MAPIPATLEASCASAERPGAICRYADARLRLAVQLEGDPMSAEAAGDARTVVPLRGLVELTVDGDDPAPLLGIVERSRRGARTSSTGRRRRSRSVWSTKCCPPVGRDPAHTRCQPTAQIDRKEFHDYWLDVHASLAMSMLDDEKKSKMGYEQVHADENASATRHSSSPVRKPTSFDGVLQCSLAEITDLPTSRCPASPKSS